MVDRYAYKDKSDQIFSNYFHTLKTRIKRMQNKELITIATILTNETDFRTQSFAQPFWEELAGVLANRDDIEEIGELFELAYIFSYIPKRFASHQQLYKHITNLLEDQDVSEVIANPAHLIVNAVKGFSLADSGSPELYHLLSKSILKHPENQDMTCKQLAKICMYFARTTYGKSKGGYGLYKILEERLQSEIMQKKIDNLEDIIGIISHLFPINLGANKTQALLEAKLFQLLTKEGGQLTVSRLVRLTQSLTHYLIKYQPLDLLIQQLIQDSITIFSSKELAKIIWSYGRHNKAELDFMKLLVNAFKAKNQEYKVAFRHFTYVVNAVVNAEIQDSDIWEYLEEELEGYMQDPKVEDHYLIKVTSLLSGCKKGKASIYNLAQKELMKPTRLHLSKQNDLSRCLLLYSTTPSLQNAPFQQHLFQKFEKSLPDLHAEAFSRSLYALTKINQTPHDYTFPIQQRLRTCDLALITPRELGALSWSLAELGLAKECQYLLPFIQQCLAYYSYRVYDDPDDTDIEDLPAVQYEQEIQFDSKFTACAFSEMLWSAVTAGIIDPAFWTEKLQAKVQRLEMREFEYGINEWIWGKNMVNNFTEFFTCLDPGHFLLMMQVEALMPQAAPFQQRIDDIKDKLSEYPTQTLQKLDRLSQKVDQEFVKDCLNTIKKYHSGAEFHQRDALYHYIPAVLNDNTVVLLYDQPCFRYLTPGYNNISNTNELLTYYKFKQHILKMQGYNCIEICKGDWIKLSQAEKSALLAMKIDKEPLGQSYVRSSQLKI